MKIPLTIHSVTWDGDNGTSTQFFLLRDAMNESICAELKDDWDAYVGGPRPHDFTEMWGQISEAQNDYWLATETAEVDLSVLPSADLQAMQRAIDAELLERQSTRRMI